MNERMKRFHQYGFPVGVLPTGPRNAISDVAGVLVGHSTRIENTDTRTGVTIVDPGTQNLFRDKLPAAVYVGNGFGKMAGTTHIEELGTLETPIALTNTLAVGPVLRALVDIVIRETKDLTPTETINAVVGETNDGFLSDIHADSIGKKDVEEAYRSRSAEFPVGNVGAGTGTRAFAWKGGVGTASRVVSLSGRSYVLGVLVQTNFGGSLRILGAPIGESLGASDFRDLVKRPDGSCMIVVATDAPLTARQLKRVAKRAFFGIIRTGSIAAHGSGDYALAFSIDRSGIEGAGNVGNCLPDAVLDAFFLAAADATEEAVYDALFAAETMTGREGNTLQALPKEEVLEYLKTVAS